VRDTHGGDRFGFTNSAPCYSSGTSTFTFRDELTLLISRPSSASSLLRSSASFFAFSSGLSSGVPPMNSGFLSAFLNASAMIAASAPENRPDSCAELLREIKEPSSPACLSWLPDAPPMASPAASPVANPLVPSKGEASRGAPAFSVIIGVAEFTESRWVGYLRLRILQMNRKARTQVAKRAKKPKTEMTAIAQWGKDEVAPLVCMLLVGFAVDVDDKSELGSPVAEDDREEVEDIEESTESA
jgi:hypothetical protein